MSWVENFGKINCREKEVYYGPKSTCSQKLEHPSYQYTTVGTIPRRVNKQDLRETEKKLIRSVRIEHGKQEIQCNL